MSFKTNYLNEPIEEEKCPKCGEDMKEYVTSYKCRNYSCRLKIDKEI